MPTRQPLTLQSGSRLHFGLWGWGPEYEHQFGGAGMMIDRPSTQVKLKKAEQFEIAGVATDRVRRVVEGCRRYWGWPSRPACRVEVVESPPQHVGLGTGTQLDLLVARGLAAWQGEQNLGLAELALAVDRGGRSSVGAYGFDRGGLVVEAGRGPGDTLGKLLYRVEIPQAWRVLLLMPTGETGLSGKQEHEAFDNLPPVARKTHERMVSLACDQLVPAATEADFDRFAHALYEYGRLAGECYETIQPATYYSEEAAALVDRLRGEGAQGVGQSSWGPTLFVILPSATDAANLADKVKGWFPGGDYQIEIAEPLNQGAQFAQAEADGNP